MAYTNGFSMPSATDPTKAARRTGKSVDSNKQADQTTANQGKWLNFVIAAASAVASYAGSRSTSRAQDRATQANLEMQREQIAANERQDEFNRRNELLDRQGIQDATAGYRQFAPAGNYGTPPERLDIDAQIRAGRGSGSTALPASASNPPSAPLAGYQTGIDQHGRTPEQQAVVGTGQLSAANTINPAGQAGAHTGNMQDAGMLSNPFSGPAIPGGNNVSDPLGDMAAGPAGNSRLRDVIRRIFGRN